jgi:hypothetical protein
VYPELLDVTQERTMKLDQLLDRHVEITVHPHVGRLVDYDMLG